MSETFQKGARDESRSTRRTTQDPVDGRADAGAAAPARRNQSQHAVSAWPRLGGDRRAGVRAWGVMGGRIGIGFGVRGSGFGVRGSGSDWFEGENPEPRTKNSRTPNRTLNPEP